MLIDSHIHIGQFNDIYFSPIYVSQLMRDVGVDYYAVSSTSMCEENYQKVLDELHQLMELDDKKVLPIMWITPDGLKGNIAWFLESDIKWKCIKIHPELHPNEWTSNKSLINEVVDIVRELSVPLLIHTGNKTCCLCSLFEEVIANNSDISIILAHGRPNAEAAMLVKKYTNAYVDSAFMPIEDMQVFLNKKLDHKLLWGTDMCIPQHFFPEVNLVCYYLEKLRRFRNIANENQYRNITYFNAQSLFKITDHII